MLVENVPIRIAKYTKGVACPFGFVCLRAHFFVNEVCLCMENAPDIWFDCKSMKYPKLIYVFTFIEFVLVDSSVQSFAFCLS